MPYAPVDVPPYQLQDLISRISDASDASPGVQVRCAQALGSEIYVGCSNGELIRFALQADDPSVLDSYNIVSRQTLPSNKPIDEITLIPSLSRAFILSDRTINFYTLPSLDPVPPNIVKPIRHVVMFTVDYEHLQRPPPPSSGPVSPLEPVEFCVIKRNNIAMYSMQERLSYLKEIPLPNGATLARRTGRSLCVADKEHYNIVDLVGASLFPIIPLSQDSSLTVKPSITVVGNNEYLIVSWTGTSSMGLFITGDGDPVRGTLEWPRHPEAICLDYPYIMALLPNDTIEIHNIETQAIEQIISAPPDTSSSAPSSEYPRQRLSLVSSVGRYLVPSTQRSDMMRKTSVRLLRASEPTVPSQ